MGEDKIKVIFRGEILRKIYRMNSNYNHCNYFDDEEYVGKPEIIEGVQLIRYEKFFECKIDRPPYDNNDIVYINELDERINVFNKCRSIKEEYIYDTNHKIKIIEDDISVKSRLEAQQNFNEEIVRYNTWRDRRGKVVQKKWYQFWK